MNISLIAAIATNQVIGLRNSIPWMLSNDLAWFRYKTLNKPVIMGRVTYEAIGKSLPQRLNIILTQKHLGKDKSVVWVNSINEALIMVREAEEVMIIGGEMIYELFLPLANRLYLTHVDTEVVGDRHFPTYKPDEWNSIFLEYHKANEKNSHNYYFEILERYYRQN